MKYFFLIGLFLSVYSSDAFALKIPDLPQVTTIQAEIDQVHRIQGVANEKEKQESWETRFYGQLRGERLIQIRPSWLLSRQKSIA